jgi:hypothetical protein
VTTDNPSTLQFNDATAPTDVLMKNGHAYVPVSAVAKLLNASVQVDGSTYKFIPLDNSRQVNGDEGKVGEMIRLGYANVTATSVNSGPVYHSKYGGSDTTAAAGQKVISIGLHIQNSTLKQQTCIVLGGDKSALADTMGRSYPVSSFSDFQHRGEDLLPGAACDIVLVFTVADDVVLKDLVYEVNFASLSKYKIARIHLQ